MSSFNESVHDPKHRNVDPFAMWKGASRLSTRVERTQCCSPSFLPYGVWCWCKGKVPTQDTPLDWVMLLLLYSCTFSQRPADQLGVAYVCPHLTLKRDKRIRLTTSIALGKQTLLNPKELLASMPYVLARLQSDRPVCCVAMETTKRSFRKARRYKATFIRNVNEISDEAVEPGINWI